MSDDASAGFYDELASRGVSRRQFLSFCAATAAMLSLEGFSVPQIAAALEQATAQKPVIWLTQGSCGGCTMSFSQTDRPDVAAVLLELLSMNYWERYMFAQGQNALEAYDSTYLAGGHILMVEGSVLTAFDGNAVLIADNPAKRMLDAAAANAEMVVAVGSCAFDGGWTKSTRCQALGQGVGDVIPSLATSGKLVNLPTCPVNPETITALLVDYLLLGKVPPLDASRRPTFAYGQTVHDNCSRRAHYDRGEFVLKFGSIEESKSYCLRMLGCEGTRTLASCGTTKWNGAANWCVDAGSPCIGCAQPNWVDRCAPFIRNKKTATECATTKFQTVASTGAAVGAASLLAAGLRSNMVDDDTPELDAADGGESQ